jgi:hypothetical protein
VYGDGKSATRDHFLISERPGRARERSGAGGIKLVPPPALFATDGLCSCLQLDRATNLEHNSRAVLDAPTLSLAPEG